MTNFVNQHNEDFYRINKDLSVEHLYDTFIKWSADKKDHINDSWWSNESGIKYSDTLNGLSIEDVWKDMTKLLAGKKVTSWNTGYDFGRIISPMMRKYGDIKYQLLDCPMMFSADIIRVSYNDYFGSWKWATLDEASSYFDISVDSDGYFHRADYDTHVTSKVIVELIKDCNFLKELVL